MNFTVGEVLALAPLRELSLVAGRGGLDRQVTRVSVLEVPLGYRRWSRGGEFFMSSLYALRDQGCEAYADTIRFIEEGRAAALCLHPGLTGFRFLDAMISEADRLEIPLILLPEDMPYCVVTDAVVGGLLGQQSAFLERSVAINRELTQIILSGGGLDGICQTVGRRMQRPVAVLGSGSYEMLAYSGGTGRAGDPRFDLLEQRFSIENATPIPLPLALASGQPTQMFTDTLETAEGQVRILAAPVVVDDQTCAHLVIWEPREPYSELDLMILAHACTAVGLEVLKRRAVLEAEHRVQLDFYGAALNGDFTSIEDATRRARHAGVTLESSYLVGVLDRGGHPIQRQFWLSGSWEGSAVVATGDVLAVVLPVPAYRARPREEADQLLRHIPGKLITERGMTGTVGVSRCRR